MNINKARICNLVRSKYPKALGIRAFLTKERISRKKRYLLTEEDVRKCEADKTRVAEIIEPYLLKWKSALRPIIKEMEDILANAEVYKKRNDKDALRIDMMFCHLAYGFLPSEYICYELEEKDCSERNICFWLFSK